MAVTKEELKNYLTPEQEDVLTTIQALIDVRLREDFIDGEKLIIGVDCLPHKKIRKKLEEIYSDFCLVFIEDSFGNERIEIS